MKKIVLSTVVILALGLVNASASDDVMMSKSSKQTKSSKKKATAKAETTQLHEFALVNASQLAKEIAAGDGEMVNTLATMLKVENKSMFIAKLQANYENIYTSQDIQVSEILNNISKI